MKLYITPGEHWGSDRAYYLIAETGETLASHISSSITWARGDLEGRRPERQAKWREQFGDYEVVNLGDDEMTEEEILRRNHAWADAARSPEGSGS